jgi:uncharacterized protein YfkK (UPF0435 family)
MKIATTENKDRSDVPFNINYFDFENLRILKRSLYQPLDYDKTPHEELQDIYLYIAKQEGWSDEMIYGLETRYFGYLIPLNKKGIADFTNVFCYAFGSSPTQERLEWFEEWLETHPELMIKIEFDAGELIQFTSGVLKNIN